MMPKESKDMSDMKRSLSLYFTYDSGDQTTEVNRHFQPGWCDGNEFVTLLLELRHCLLACGFSESLIDSHITIE